MLGLIRVVRAVKEEDHAISYLYNTFKVKLEAMSTEASDLILKLSYLPSIDANVHSDT